MSSRNGLGDLPPLTQSSLRRANAETVAALREGDSERDFGDKWGTSASTVGNVQNHRNDLSLQNWLKLGKVFGPNGVNAALGLIGLRAGFANDVVLDVGDLPHEVASLLPLIMELWSDNHHSAEDMQRLEDAGAVDAFLKIADFLRSERVKFRTTER